MSNVPVSGYAALALNGMVYPSTRIIAPAIGGILIATLGFKWNFFLEAAAFIGKSFRRPLKVWIVSIEKRFDSTKPMLTIQRVVFLIAAESQYAEGLIKALVYKHFKPLVICDSDRVKFRRPAQRSSLGSALTAYEQSNASSQKMYSQRTLVTLMPSNTFYPPAGSLH